MSTCLLQFHSIATEMALGAQYRHQALSDALHGMAMTVSTLAKGQEWPFVTIPSELNTWTNRLGLGISFIALHVLVEEGERQAWSRYTDVSSAWGNVSDTPIPPFVWTGLDQDEDPFGLAAVYWQAEPINTRKINYNQLSESFNLSVGENCIVDTNGKKQLFISYGKKKDTELLLNYGFLQGVDVSDSNADARRRKKRSHLTGKRWSNCTK